MAGDEPRKKRSPLRMGCGGLIGLIVLIIIIATASGGGKKGSTATPSTSAALATPTTSTNASVPTTATQAAPSTTHAAASRTTVTAKPKASPKPTLTLSQQNAVRAANSYLAMEGFSYMGLIQQLSSPDADDYSRQDATVAVNTLHVNWDTEAVRTAKSYLKMESFSCNGLIHQLSSAYADRYTSAEAQYAAQKVGLC